MALSTAMSITARVTVTGFLTVSCFKRSVVDNTAQVLSKAEKASAGLAVYSVCLSTITLVLAADKAAQKILSNEFKRVPAPIKDDYDADSDPPSANGTTSFVAPQLVEPSHLQQFRSPSQLRLIESTETISAPISNCTPNDSITSAKPAEPYHLQPSPTSSQSRLTESRETISAPISTCTPNNKPISTKPVEPYYLQTSPTSSQSRLIASPKLLNLYLTIYTPVTTVTHCNDCDQYLQQSLEYIPIYQIDFCDMVTATFQTA
jgi:hypothetical protein